VKKTKTRKSENTKTSQKLSISPYQYILAQIENQHLRQKNIGIWIYRIGKIFKINVKVRIKVSVSGGRSFYPANPKILRIQTQAI
jgi:hypothetical protein